VASVLVDVAVMLAGLLCGSARGPRLRDRIAECEQLCDVVAVHVCASVAKLLSDVSRDQDEAR